MPCSLNFGHVPLQQAGTLRKLLLGEPMQLAEVPYVCPEKTLILVHPLFSYFVDSAKEYNVFFPCVR